MRSGGLRAPLRPMPRPETRGFLERRRARRAPVAAGPERGDAPREGSRGALCSRYASTISRRSTAVSGHKIVAALSTLRLARMEIESTKSENRQRHAVIKKYKDFFFRTSDSFEKRFLRRTFGKPQSLVASLFERSARHPPAHTMQIFVKTRASIPRLSIENPV